MSKSNVNPNHYKVAGRGRQGEDIAQARNRQKHAESLARRRAERGVAAPKTPAPPKGAAARGAASGRVGKPGEPAQAAMSTASKTRAVVPKVPPAQKRTAARNDFDAMPATGAVAGAFGKEPSPGRRPARKK